MSINYREGDIDTMLADFGVQVSFGAITKLAIVDMPDEIAAMNGDGIGIIGKMISVLFKTSDFPGLTVGSEVVIDGVTYEVRDRLRRDEGAMTRLMVEKK